MRRYFSANPIRTFLLLVLVLSWPFLIYGFGWFGSREAILTRYLLACTGMLMVALSAFITRAFVERKGFHDVGWNLSHISWYLAALLLFVFLWLGPPLAALSFGKLSWNQSIKWDERMVIILSLGGFSLLAGFGEEFGWRGYLLPRWLAEPRYARAVLVAIGLIWGVWHCAIAIGPLLRLALAGTISWPSTITAFLGSCLQMIDASIALSFIFGALWLKTDSIFLCAFLHGYWIGFRDIVYLFVSFPPIYRSVTLFTVFAAWLISYQWLKRYERGQVLRPFYM